MNTTMKGVMLFTDEGVRIVSLKHSGRIMTPEDCFRYCNYKGDEFENRLRANRLKLKSMLFSKDPIRDKDWFTNQDNFREATINIQPVRKRI